MRLPSLAIDFSTESAGSDRHRAYRGLIEVDVVVGVGDEHCPTRVAGSAGSVIKAAMGRHSPECTGRECTGRF